jgi:hypothetical protein
MIPALLFEGLEPMMRKLNGNPCFRKIPDAIRLWSEWSFRDYTDGLRTGEKVYDYLTLLLRDSDLVYRERKNDDYS